MKIDENSCVVDGVKLVAAPATESLGGVALCVGCHMRGAKVCGRVVGAPCTASDRADKRSVIWLRADTQPSDGWTGMPQLPEVAGVCEVECRGISGEKVFSKFDGKVFCVGRSSAKEARESANEGAAGGTILRWRMVDPDKPAEPSTVKQSLTVGVTAEEKRALVTPAAYPAPGSLRSFSRRIMPSDVDGVTSFVPPPEVVAEPEVVRVSTLRRGWNWLGGAR